MMWVADARSKLAFRISITKIMDHANELRSEMSPLVLTNTLLLSGTASVLEVGFEGRQLNTASATANPASSINCSNV